MAESGVFSVKQQGIDSTDKWAAICEHGTILTGNNFRNLKQQLDKSETWCVECGEAVKRIQYSATAAEYEMKNGKCVAVWNTKWYAGAGNGYWVRVSPLYKGRAAQITYDNYLKELEDSAK